MSANNDDPQGIGEDELTWLRRAMAVRGACSRALAGATDRKRLAEQMCHALVGEGGYRAAWVCPRPRGDERPNHAVVQAGFEERDVACLPVSWCGPERQDCPITAVMRSRQAIKRNIFDVGEGPWLAHARSLGCRSFTALPLLTAGTCHGVLVVLTDDHDVSHPEEIGLLTDLAGDLAIGVERCFEDIWARLNLAQDLSVAAFIVDAEGALLRVNEILRRMTGLSDQQLIGTSFEDLIHPDDRVSGVVRWSATMDSGEPYLSEVRLLHSDGTFTWGLVAVTPVDATATAYRTHAGVVFDISRSKEPESALPVEAGFSDAVLKALPGAVVLFDDKGALIRANPGALSASGRTSEEILELDDPLKIVVPGDRPAAEHALQQALDEGTSCVELSISGNDGREIPFFVTLEKVVSHGQPCVLCAGIDISSLREAENKLREGSDFIAAIIDAIPGLFYVVDQQGRLIRWNAGFQALVGRSPEEMVTITLLEIVADDHQQKAWDALNRCILEGEVTAELNLMSESGEQVPFLCSAQSVMIGRSWCAAGVALDVSEYLRMEQSLTAQMIELERVNSELESFAHVASHDLQEPLRMVVSFTQLLAKRYGDQLDDDANEFIGFAVDGAMRMQRLIEALLRFSCSGPGGLHRTVFEIRRAVGDAVANLRNSIEEAGAVVTSDVLGVLNADETQLQQVFQNLVANALRYRGDDRPKIHISGECDAAGVWTFCVRDNGVGIAAGQQERIFAPFRRVVLDSQQPGAGIGLAICKRVVEAHGGRIWVESAPGEGATFFFTIPRLELS